MLTSGWNLTWECSTSTIKTLDLGINLLSSKSADFIFCQMCLITDQVLLAPTLAESNPQTARGIDSTQHDSLNIITFHAQVNKKPSITSIFAIPNEWLDIQNMLSLSESDQIKSYFHISNGISGNELIFAFPCGKLVTYNTMLLCGRWFHKDNFSFIRFWYRVIFFTPLKDTKK